MRTSPVTFPCKAGHLFWKAVPGGLALYPFGPRIWLKDEAGLSDETVLSQIDRLDRPEVYLDLQCPEYISSVVMSTFIQIGKRANNRGGRLLLCNLWPNVLDCFEIGRPLPSWFVPGAEMPDVKMEMPDPAWLHWNGGTVLALARTIMKEQDFALLPVLADALEDAGCHTADILDHLRGPGPHILNCFALNLLLNRD